MALVVPGPYVNLERSISSFGKTNSHLSVYIKHMHGHLFMLTSDVYTGNYFSLIAILVFLLSKNY